MNDQQTLDENRTQKRLSNMNTQTPYGLLLRSHETGRSILETVIYALLGVCVMVSIVQLAQQLPINGLGDFVRHTTELSAHA